MALQYISEEAEGQNSAPIW